jgi:TPP-dependent pyruvate/acetoin dehydrogenase alpha subunit
MKRTRDPVRIARDRLLSQGKTEAEMAAIDAEVEADIADAVQFAEESAPALESTVRSTVLAPSVAYPQRFDGAHAPFSADSADAPGAE